MPSSILAGRKLPLSRSMESITTQCREGPWIVVRVPIDLFRRAGFRRRPSEGAMEGDFDFRRRELCDSFS